MVDEVVRKRRGPNRGPNLAPLQDLLAAQRIHTEYKDKAATEESLKRISRAIGSDKPLPLLRENLDKVFDEGSPLSDITLHLALVETRKNKKGGIG
jgi:hypothetical protein